MNYLVLSARRYDFTDQTGVHRDGVTVTYADSGETNDGDRKGLELMQISAPVTLWHQLDAVPGFYRLDFRQRPGPKGRPTLQLVGVECVAPVHVDQAE